jgi:hypothetical protein
MLMKNTPPGGRGVVRQHAGASAAALELPADRLSYLRRCTGAQQPAAAGCCVTLQEVIPQDRQPPRGTATAGCSTGHRAHSTVDRHARAARGGRLQRARALLLTGVGRVCRTHDGGLPVRQACFVACTVGQELFYRQGRVMASHRAGTFRSLYPRAPEALGASARLKRTHQWKRSSPTGPALRGKATRGEEGSDSSRRPRLRAPRHPHLQLAGGSRFRSSSSAIMGRGGRAQPVVSPAWRSCPRSRHLEPLNAAREGSLPFIMRFDAMLLL